MLSMRRSFYALMVTLVAVMSFAVGHYVGFERVEIPIVGEAEGGFFIKPLFSCDLEESATEVGTPREIDDLVNEMSTANDDLINDMSAVLQMPEESRKATLDEELKKYEAHLQQSIRRLMESREPEVESVVAPPQKPAALDEELIGHFKKLAACAITPYGSVIAETVMVKILIGTEVSWAASSATVIFQTEDGHWWRVGAKRNRGGSWCYDSPSRKDSPLTYDTEAELRTVPPGLIESPTGSLSKRVGIVERFPRAKTIIPKSDG